MKPHWSPLINMRWKTMPDGTKVLQQAWGKYVLGDTKWEQTSEYRWEDVPTDIEDPKYWSKE
jgi:hypothetical protein